MTTHSTIDTTKIVLVEDRTISVSIESRIGQAIYNALYQEYGKGRSKFDNNLHALLFYITDKSLLKALKNFKYD